MFLKIAHFPPVCLHNLKCMYTMTLKYWFIENSQSQRHTLYNLLKWQASDPNTPLTWFNTYTSHPGQRAFAFFLILVFCWGNSRSLAVTETNLPRGRLHSTASQRALTLPGCGPGVELHTGMSEITCSPPRNQMWVKPENKLTTILEDEDFQKPQRSTLHPRAAAPSGLSSALTS